jgi:hypothetical protein
MYANGGIWNDGWMKERGRTSFASAADAAICDILWHVCRLERTMMMLNACLRFTYKFVMRFGKWIWSGPWFDHARALSWKGARLKGGLASV